MDSINLRLVKKLLVAANHLIFTAFEQGHGVQ